MNTILKCLLVLILLADVPVLLALVTSLMFGFSFGVRVAGTNDFWEVSRMKLTIVLTITVFVAFASLAS